MPDITPTGFWNDLRQHLRVEVVNRGNSIILENTAVNSPFVPTVRFTNVSITSSGDSGLVAGVPPTLSPGQKVEIDRGEKVDVFGVIDVDATIDIHEYMKFRILSEDSATAIQESVISWFKSFEEFDVFTRIDEFISSIPTVTKDSTLAEIERLESIGDDLNVIYSDFDKAVGTWLTNENDANPHRLIRTALREIGTHVRRISKAAKDKDVSLISAEYERLLEVEDPSTEFSDLKVRIYSAYELDS